MKNLLTAFLLLALVAQARADRYSTEDESRFRATDYKKAEPGMLAPAQYIERAKAALRKRYQDIRLSEYPDPSVTRRTYTDAPPADRDVICVKFFYYELIKAPVSVLKRLPAPDFPVRPVILVLMRKDLSKIYVNEVYYQIW